MSQKVQVILTDDISGGQADETVNFALDGKTYEVDLNTENATALRNAMGPFIAVARRGNSTGPKSAKKTTRNDLDAVRAWARETGYQVSDRGRVSRDVLSAYDAAH